MKCTKCQRHHTMLVNKMCFPCRGLLSTEAKLKRIKEYIDSKCKALKKPSRFLHEFSEKEVLDKIQNILEGTG